MPEISVKDIEEAKRYLTNHAAAMRELVSSTPVGDRIDVEMIAEYEAVESLISRLPGPAPFLWPRLPGEDNA